MNLILPPHSKISQPVKSYEEIKEDAAEMIKMIEMNDFGKEWDRILKEFEWPGAYALSHSQVSDNPKTFFVVNHTDLNIRKNFKDKIIINPIIESVDKKTLKNHSEACMSMPYCGREKVMRYDSIKVCYYAPGWFGRLKKRFEIKTGVAAFIFQHEIEHFNGKY